MPFWRELVMKSEDWMKPFRIKRNWGTLTYKNILREESEAAIFEMLKDLVSRVKSEIEDEKREREEG